MLFFVPVAIFVSAFAANPEALVLIRTVHSKGQVQGSGVVLDRRTVVTSAHVIHPSDECAVILIRDYSGEVTRARIAAVDLPNDIAVLTTQGPIGRPAKIGKSFPAEGVVLETVSVPGGVWTFSYENIATVADDRPAFLSRSEIQLGASGGGVFDQNGQLVGIIQGSSSTKFSLGLATPITLVSVVTAPSRVHFGALPACPDDAGVGVLSNSIEVLPDSRVLRVSARGGCTFELEPGGLKIKAGEPVLVPVTVPAVTIRGGCNAWAELCWTPGPVVGPSPPPCVLRYVSAKSVLYLRTNLPDATTEELLQTRPLKGRH